MAGARGVVDEFLGLLAADGGLPIFPGVEIDAALHAQRLTRGAPQSQAPAVETEEFGRIEAQGR